MLPALPRWSPKRFRSFKVKNSLLSLTVLSRPALPLRSNAFSHPTPFLSLNLRNYNNKLTQSVSVINNNDTSTGNNKKMAEWKSKLAEWCQRRGDGNFHDNFVVSFETFRDREYVCVLLHIETDHTVRGPPRANKRQSEKVACEEMYSYILDNIGPPVAPRYLKRNSSHGFKSKLGEWSQKRGQGNFNASFEIDVEMNDRGRYVSKIVHKESQHTIFGPATNSKKLTEQRACEKMFNHVMENYPVEFGAGPELRFEALIGDKILDHCLALKYWEECNTDTSMLHLNISSRSNNKRLREKMPEINLDRTGNDQVDASRVEQWVWHQHKKCNYVMEDTMKAIAPLLE